MSPAALADVVLNSRAKVAAGNADYLDVAVVALADDNGRLRGFVRAVVTSADGGYLDLAPSIVVFAKELLANLPAPAKANDGPKETTDE